LPALASSCPPTLDGVGGRLGTPVLRQVRAEAEQYLGSPGGPGRIRSPSAPGPETPGTARTRSGARPAGAYGIAVVRGVAPPTGVQDVQEESMDIKDDDKERRNAVALFRYGVIGDLLHWPRRKRGFSELIAKKAERDHEIPGSHRSRVAPEAIRDWLKDYRRGGLDALLPKVRSDQGQARAIPQQVADLLCMLKEDKPALSVRMVIEAARASGNVPAELDLAPATVHRLLSRAGLMDRRPEEPTSNDRRRFSFEKAGELCPDNIFGPRDVDRA
jgi:transposase